MFALHSFLDFHFTEYQKRSILNWVFYNRNNQLPLKAREPHGLMFCSEHKQGDILVLANYLKKINNNVTIKHINKTTLYMYHSKEPDYIQSFRLKYKTPKLLVDDMKIEIECFY